MLVCLNGTFIPYEEAKLPISDGGFLYGDTLFETLKAHRQKILLQAEHLDRLELSAKLLNFPCNRKAIEASLQKLASSLTAPASRVRLTLSRGPCQSLNLPAADAGWYLLTAVSLAETKDSEREIGADCITALNQRVNPLSHLPQMKRGNYADCLYAIDYARSKGAREALFVDPDGNVLEGSTSNLFALIDRHLVTPPVGRTILAGVMRRQLIETATEIGIEVDERDLKLEELTSADEVYLSNSLIDILPVASINGRPVKRGENWKSLLKNLQQRIGT
jgi:branched-subunit amino acid aminotransferase/4-amino-4-deoxychorismate lyase